MAVRTTTILNDGGLRLDEFPLVIGRFSARQAEGERGYDGNGRAAHLSVLWVFLLVQQPPEDREHKQEE